MIENNQKINVAIAGGAGRMGQALLQAISADSKLNLSLTTLKNNPLFFDFDSDFEILIDFTTPSATLAHLEFCVAHNKKIVIGTTGFSDAQLIIIQQAAHKIPILMSPNMSMGVNLCFELIKQAAKILEANLGDKLDIAIVEAHHRHKVDAPSGTALKMGEVISTAVPNAKAISFSSIRAGDIVGDHTVVFASEGERIEITHKASSRATFAQGALRAATWLQNKPPGLYTMQDVLF